MRWTGKSWGFCLSTDGGGKVMSVWEDRKSSQIEKRGPRRKEPKLKKEPPMENLQKLGGGDGGEETRLKKRKTGKRGGGGKGWSRRDGPFIKRPRKNHPPPKALSENKGGVSDCSKQARGKRERGQGTTSP